LQVILAPRGALTFLAGRLRVLIVLAVCAHRDRSQLSDRSGATLKEEI
jgi:hypothetical protein